MTTSRLQTQIVCRKCGRVLGRGAISAGILALACPRCKTILEQEFHRTALLPQFFSWEETCRAFDRPMLATY